MGLDIYHYRVIEPQYRKEDHILNVSKLPHIAEKFKNFVFMEEVEYIDWDKTFLSINNKIKKSFNTTIILENYHCYMISSKGYYFVHNDEKDNSTIEDFGDDDFLSYHEDKYLFFPMEKLITYFLMEPHLAYKEIGYQRKGVSEIFYEKMENGTYHIDSKILKQVYKYCIKETKSHFKKFFMDNWNQELDIFVFDW
jgi:hypothetical protein